MTAAQQKMSVEQYLEAEERSQERHEYVAGSVYAMVGTTFRHNQIALSVAAALRPSLRGGTCRVFINDVKLRVESADAFFYPDVFVHCGTGASGTTSVATSATLVIEVLSDSTSAYDRGEKMLMYRKLPSLKEIVLVWQDRRLVEIYRRADIGWTYLTFEGDDVVKFESVNAELPVSTIYEDTDVP
ncbi:MAG: Uma2 family endonuclease [Archangium sp.]